MDEDENGSKNVLLFCTIFVSKLLTQICRHSSRSPPAQLRLLLGERSAYIVPEHEPKGIRRVRVEEHQFLIEHIETTLVLDRKLLQQMIQLCILENISQTIVAEPVVVVDEELHGSQLVVLHLTRSGHELTQKAYDSTASFASKLSIQNSL